MHHPLSLLSRIQASSCSHTISSPHTGHPLSLIIGGKGGKNIWGHVEGLGARSLIGAPVGPGHPSPTMDTRET
ncbi:hypothetical protein XELAEV_18005085mg [Xenopus laevis]|uniref:Uncharacterized protein n=1 Tax=Xenopus laevis TaxID=8355 RepID=A0A974DWN1_XENLA|nr:hypothetical protein XELAEV_18005085mg [Xenopus laevis]